LLADNISGKSADAHVAAAIYSANMLALSIGFALIWIWATRDGSLLPEGVDAVSARRSGYRFLAGLGAYAATIVLSFVSAPITLLVHFFIALFYVFDQLTIGSDSGQATEETS
jgi:hypothetical protein